MATAPQSKPANNMRRNTGRFLNRWVCLYRKSMAEAARPITNPQKTRKGSSHKLPSSISGMAKAGSLPKTILDITPPVTAERITGIKPVMVYSIKMASIAKMTPARGVLNDAAIAAATPQAVSVRKLLLGNLSCWPNKLELAAPR